jgi:hypothetical protein
MVRDHESPGPVRITLKITCTQEAQADVMVIEEACQVYLDVIRKVKVVRVFSVRELCLR